MSMAKQYTVEGRSFRTESDYRRALKDKELIDKIKQRMKTASPSQRQQIIKNVLDGKFPFQTMLGEDFKDELREDKSSVPDSTQKTEVSDTIVKEMLRKQEKQRRFLVTVASMVAVASMGYLIFYSFQNQRTNDNVSSLNELKEKDVMEPVEGQVVIHYADEEEIVAPDVLDEYKNLLNKNKRLIGWLKIDDTNIDYPVMQTSDNEYYLDHNVNQEKDKNGSIFMDKDCDVVKGSTNYILYGHHMRSGQMFGYLDKYEKESYFQDHQYIKFDTIYEKGIYQVMFVFRSKVYSEEEITFKYYQFIDATGPKEFDSNMEEMKAMSLYDTGVEAHYGDQLLTLSTCDYQETNGRFVVVAKRIDKEEQ